MAVIAREATRSETAAITVGLLETRETAWTYRSVENATWYVQTRTTVARMTRQVRRYRKPTATARHRLPSCPTAVALVISAFGASAIATPRRYVPVPRV